MDPEYRGLRILQRASSRSKRRGKSRGRSSDRSIPFVKGQKAFYLSIKGIVKVTVVGIHHDAKLEPYYTIKLKDGKEKQTDGKHLTPIGGGRSGDGGSGIYSHSASGSESRKQQRLVAAAEPDVMTDHMTESSSEAGEIIIKEANDVPNAVREDVSQRTIGSGGAGVREECSEAPSSEDDDSKKFDVDQDAFYRSPDGSILKIRILSYGEDPNQPRRYAISLPDGSRMDNIKSSRIATLMDLTRKELSMLMKERNKRQNNERSAQSLSHKHADSASAEMALVDTASKEEEILALPPLKTVIKMVEAKTAEGGTKMVPMYEVGMHVRYKNAAGIQPAKILGAHLDDLMEPYYSIRFEDGREKQTDNAHIMMEAGGEKEKNEGQKEEGGGNEEEEEKSKEEASEEVLSQAEKAIHRKQEKEVVDNQHEGKKKRRGSFSVKQQPSLDQVQNLQHLSDPAPERKVKRSNSTDFSQRTQDASSASTTKNRNPTTVASASVASTLNPTTPATSKIVMGDEVLYNSSQGELLRATVVSSHRDRKNRPYYVVRLKNRKEKQVYGHRLQPYVRPDRDGSRRARSHSRGAGSRGQSKSRGRSSSSKVSEASTSARRGHGRTRQDRSRSESIHSHKSAPLPKSSRRSRASRPMGSEVSSNHHTVEESSVPVRRTRSVSLSSSLGEGRYAGEPTPKHRTTRSSSEKSGLYRRSQSMDYTGKSAVGTNGSHGERRRNLGRVRSRSSAPSSEYSSSQGSSSSRHHQLSAAHHQHAIATAPWGSSRRPSTLRMPVSSKVATTEGESDGEGQRTAIAKLRNFRKSFSSRKK